MIKVCSDKEYLTQWPGGETQALERMKVKFSERNLYQARNNNNRANTGIRSKSYSRHFLVHFSFDSGIIKVLSKNFRPFCDTVFERLKVQNSKSSNTDLEPETTGLSAYLNFGALSVRTLWYAAVSVDDEQTAVTVHGQLLYREFFYCVAFTVSP